MLAAKCDHLAIVKLLLAAGADPCASNEFRATALHWVRAKQQEALALPTGGSHHADRRNLSVSLK
jgi:ankyrin repeat protein